jgi:hypothetical protein
MKRIDAIEEAVKEAHAVPTAPAELSEEEVKKAKDLEEARYFKLRKPITCGKLVLDSLLCDPSELSGEKFFQLDMQFRTEHHFVYATSLNKTGESLFLALVLAELNRITVEDLRKISFPEAERALRRVQNFLYRESV